MKLKLGQSKGSKFAFAKKATPPKKSAPPVEGPKKRGRPRVHPVPSNGDEEARERKSSVMFSIEWKYVVAMDQLVDKHGLPSRVEALRKLIDFASASKANAASIFSPQTNGKGK